MTAVSVKIIKTLYALSGNNCTFPGCQSKLIDVQTGVHVGKVCHIKANSPGGPRYDANQSNEERSGAANLILLCGNHHDVIDQQPMMYDTTTLKEMKAIHQQNAGRNEKDEDSLFARFLINNSPNIKVENTNGQTIVNSPGAVINATNIVNKNSKTTVAPAPGTVGNDKQLAGYMAYLIKKYNTYASKDTTRKTKFSFGALSNNIATKFGVEWKNIPAERFSEVVIYLHGRIDKTIIAKRNKRMGHRAYRNYDDFLADKFNPKK